MTQLDQTLDPRGQPDQKLGSKCGQIGFAKCIIELKQNLNPFLGQPGFFNLRLQPDPTFGGLAKLRAVFDNLFYFLNFRHYHCADNDHN